MTPHPTRTETSTKPPKNPKLVTCHLYTTQKISESDGEQFLENNTWNGEHFEKG